MAKAALEPKSMEGVELNRRPLTPILELTQLHHLGSLGLVVVMVVTAVMEAAKGSMLLKSASDCTAYECICVRG
jgi:hypothetical protein